MTVVAKHAATGPDDQQVAAGRSATKAESLRNQIDEFLAAESDLHPELVAQWRVADRVLEEVLSVSRDRGLIRPPDGVA